MVSISIVSHGQLDLVQRLLKSLESDRPKASLEILVTENRDQTHRSFDHQTGFDVAFTVNPRPRGLSANTNAAFRRARGEHFCILNPDVVFRENVFDPLVRRLEENRGGIRAPLVIDESGWVQDSARRLPSPWELLFRRVVPRRLSMAEAAGLPAHPDWLAAILLIMPSAVFQQLGGLNEKYHLYFEDVEFCTRARLAGARLYLDKDLQIIHRARRRSRRNPVYTAWHLAGAIRFFSSPAYRQARKLGS